MEIRVIHNGTREEGSITIDTTGTPLLMNGNTVVDGGNLAKLDILESLLEERDWNITNRLFLDESGNICMSLKKSYPSAIPKIENEKEKIDLSENSNMEIQGRLEKSFKEALEFNPLEYEAYSNITLNYLNSLGKDQAGIVTIEEDYTNILNFNRFIQESNEFMEDEYSITALVTLGIVKNEKRINKDILVKPFYREKDENNNLVTNYGKVNTNFYYSEKGVNYVLAEIRDGVLRLFPLHESITECIILSCTIIYEEFRKL